jgi:hypothetical protein
MQEITEEQKQKIIEEVNALELDTPPEGTVLTEVTSIRQEELKTGKEIPVPSAEKLVMNAIFGIEKNKKLVYSLVSEMPKKQILRALVAALDLPTDKVPVYLKQEKEKALFATLQQAQQQKFIVINHHVNQLIKEEKLKQKETN